MSAQIFSGVWCPAITPFVQQGDSAGGIDYPALAAHLAHLGKAGINGVLLMGSLGEFVSLSQAERLELMAKARALTELPMIVNISATCMEELWQLAAAARTHGYQAVMVLPHYYFAQSSRQLEAYFTDIGRQVDLPWLAYNFPARTGCDIDAALVRRLALNVPNFVGIKDTVDCASHTRAIVQAVKAVRPNFTVLAGFDEYFLPNLMNGGDGALCGLVNVVPELFVAAATAFRLGLGQECARFHAEIGRLSALYGLGEDFVSTVKCAVAARGLNFNPLARNYAGTLNEEQWQSLKELLSDESTLSLKR